MSSDKHLASIVRNVREHLVEAGISYKVDDSSGSIGRRYARTDEIGIPFGVTVDKDSKDEPHTVTLRHTPTMEQVRLKVINKRPLLLLFKNNKLRSRFADRRSWTDDQKSRRRQRHVANDRGSFSALHRKR